MAITNLQQARQMYALGQRVRFQGGGRDASRGDFSSPSADGGPGGKGGAVDTGDLGSEKANEQANQDANMSARDRAIATQYTNVPTPTVTVGVDKFGNPITVPTTYKDKRARELGLKSLSKKGISSFDPRVTKLVNPFSFSLVAQPQQKQFGLFDLALMAATGGLFGGKIAQGARMFSRARNLANLAQTIGLTDKNVVDSFTSSFADKFSNLDFGKGKKSTKDDDPIRGGDGIEGLGNRDSLDQEYLALLKKFNTGVFSDADQVRFTFLRKVLGK